MTITLANDTDLPDTSVDGSTVPRESLGNPWDTSDPYISADTLNLIRKVSKCYVQTPIVLIGLPANALCLVVFWKQGVSDRITLLLFWLALADFLNLAFQVAPTCMVSDPVVVNNVIAIGNALTSRIRLWCTFVSGTLIVVISVERCLSVVMPLKARRLLTYRPMVVAILLSYLVPLVGYLPWFLGDTVEWRLDPSTNRSMAYMVPTPWFPSRNLLFITTYFSTVGHVAFLFIVIACNSITVIHLRRMSRKRAQMTGTGSEAGGSPDNKITVMLLFISFVYATLLISQVCIYLVRVFVPEFYPYKKYNNTAIATYQIFIYPSSTINSTINFFAYVALSSRFRATLKDLFSCFRRT